MVAGRNMRKFLGLSTGTAEGVGLLTIAAMVETGFTSGFAYIGMSIVVLLTVPIVYGMTGFVINRYREAKVVTVAEYAQRRYSKGVRVTLGVVLAFSGILNLAIFPIIASQFLTHFLNTPQSIELAGVSIPFVPALMAVLIGLALLFAYSGGMVSVILTDFIQSIMIAIMGFAITYCVIKDVGFSGFHQTIQSNFGQSGVNPFASETFGILFIIMMIFRQILGFPSFAPTMQKIASTDNAKTARQMTMLAWFFGQGRALMMVAWGVAALAIMGPVVSDGMGMEQGLYTKVAGAMYLGNLIPPVLLGFVLSGMLAAFISTVDSFLLTWSTVITQDVICPLLPRRISERAQLRILKGLVALIAISIFAFGIVYKPAETLLEYVIMTGTMMLGSGIILIGGLYWRRGSTAGAYTAVIFCCLIPVLHMVFNRVVDGYSMKFGDVGLLGILASIALYIAVSLAIPQKQKETETEGSEN